MEYPYFLVPNRAFGVLPSRLFDICAPCLYARTRQKGRDVMRTFKASKKNRTNYTYRFLTGEKITLAPDEVGEDWIVKLHTDDDATVDADRRENYHTPYQLDYEKADCIADTAPNPLEGLIANMDAQAHEELLEKLRVAVQTLQPQQIALIHKVFYERRTNVDIAAEENVTEAAIRGRLKKIYTTLRKRMAAD